MLTFVPNYYVTLFAMLKTIVGLAMLVLFNLPHVTWITIHNLTNNKIMFQVHYAPN